MRLKCVACEHVETFPGNAELHSCRRCFKIMTLEELIDLPDPVSTDQMMPELKRLYEDIAASKFSTEEQIAKDRGWTQLFAYRMVQQLWIRGKIYISQRDSSFGVNAGENW